MSEALQDLEPEIVEEDIALDLPRWIDVLIMPTVNVAAALAVSAVIIMMLGENPVSAVRYLISGAIGYQEALGYTLFYTTSFVFTGLAVAVAFHCGLLNLGGEGQAYIGGLGVAVVCLNFGFLPPIFVLPVAIAGGVLFGAIWGLIPGYLQGARGSHIVITSIMFNFLAAAVMSYLLLNVFADAEQSSAETREFAATTWLPLIHDVAKHFGYSIAASPLNVSAVLALACCFLVWFVIWQTAIGYEIRVVGKDHLAAVYAGISPVRVIMVAMAISGGLAGLLAVNELMGSQHRLTLNFVGGYGLVGVAVALMGRNHPLGICLAALLFGGLYQGGSELSFELPAIPREMLVLIQGLVILFSGALSTIFRPHVATAWHRRHEARDALRRQRERLRAAHQRRRAARAQQAQRTAKERPAPAVTEEAEPEIYLDAYVAQEKARMRGEAEFLEHLRKYGQLPEQPDPEPPPRRRRRWLPRLPRLPRLPKIRVRVERDDDD